MPRIEIVDNIPEIPAGWVVSPKFNSKDLRVSSLGKTSISSFNHLEPNPQVYRIVSKIEHQLPGREIFTRYLWGAFLIVLSIGLGIFSKSVRNFFKTKEKIRYSIAEKGYFLRDSNKIYIIQNSFFKNAIVLGNSWNLVEIRKGGERCVKNVETSHIFSRPLEDEGYSIIDSLLRIAQQDSFSGPPFETFKIPENPFYSFFESPLTHDTAQEFLGTLPPYVDGTPIILKLNAEFTLDVLKLKKEQKIAPSILPLTETTATKLFEKWAGTGHVEIIQLLLELTPNIIHRLKTFLIITALNPRAKEDCRLLLNFMDSHNIHLTNQESWVKKVILDDINFDYENFKKLPRKFQKDLCKIAIIFESKNFAKKLIESKQAESPATRKPEQQLITPLAEILRGCWDNFIKFVLPPSQ